MVLNALASSMQAAMYSSYAKSGGESEQLLEFLPAFNGCLEAFKIMKQMSFDFLQALRCSASLSIGKVIMDLKDLQWMQPAAQNAWPEPAAQNAQLQPAVSDAWLQGALLTAHSDWIEKHRWQLHMA